MNETQRQQAKAALTEIYTAILETVNEAPNGAPCGPLYMALIHVWPSMTSHTFNLLIQGLIDAGKVRRVGHCLYRVTPCPLCGLTDGTHVLACTTNYSQFD